MKIYKYNEAVKKSKEQEEFDIFIEMIINKFYPDGDLENMGSYECEIKYLGSRNYIRSSFYFMVIEEEELKIMQNVVEYFRTFDPTVNMFIRKYKDQMVECCVDIRISTAYSEIYKDLKRNEDSKKYNL